MTPTQIQKLQETLQDFELAARAALAAGDMAGHVRYGRKYHDAADHLKLVTGIDPRPEA